MVAIRQQIQHNSGIPLGGIGTGSVEIRPDGLFHEWHMFNVGQWNPDSPCKCPEAMGPEDLLFVLRVRTSDGTILARYLALREQIHDLYSFAWARSVEAIHFEGTFPIARLTYEDDTLPVEVRAEVFSPFVPLDSRASGTPGFYVYFRVRNLAQEPVEVSILGVMKNAAGYAQESRKPRNRLVGLHGAKAIRLTADDLQPDHCSTGDMTFAALGGRISHITGSFAEDHRLARMRHCRYGIRALGILHQFRDDGKLPNLNAEVPPSSQRDFQAAQLSDAERKKLLAELLQYPVFYDEYCQVKRVDPAEVNSPEFLDDLAARAIDLEERKAEWGWAALCSQTDIAPEAQTDSLFAVGWRFPNHISPTGQNLGHQYEHWFANSLDVASYLIANFSELREETLAMPEAIHGSSLPPEVADAITGQLSTLTKCTWWTKSGDFGVWEGYGCCGFHTTDITYQGSFPIIALFPELQKVQMELGARFQRKDGRVHHFFTPDFSAVDNGFDRVDMNQQFVMLAARDYLWTGDKAYLERLWPHIIRAMDNTALLDSDGDGLPDTDTRRNTYDCWDFTGCPSYIASLWLGALKAAVRLANEMGESERAVKWQVEYHKGVASFDRKLWNGDYYVLWRDGDEVDECCMSDQMSGDWFAASCGWGPILGTDRIKKALRAIVRGNFRKGEGLRNASYPAGKKRRIAASNNYQADAPWTGIEYTVAALLVHYGMVSGGLDIVRDIHNRYLQAGRFWSHVECGSHYYRAMSAWTLLPALTGFAWDQPSGALTLAPAVDEPSCDYPFFTSTGWGCFHQEQGLAGQLAEITLAAGEVPLRVLHLPKLTGLKKPEVLLNGAELRCEADAEANGVGFAFDPPIVLKPGDLLAVAR